MCALNKKAVWIQSLLLDNVRSSRHEDYATTENMLVGVLGAIGTRLQSLSIVDTFEVGFMLGSVILLSYSFNYIYFQGKTIPLHWFSLFFLASPEIERIGSIFKRKRVKHELLANV